MKYECRLKKWIKNKSVKTGDLNANLFKLSQSFALFFIHSFLIDTHISYFNHATWKYDSSGIEWNLIKFYSLGIWQMTFYFVILETNQSQSIISSISLSKAKNSLKNNHISGHVSIA
jgi:hypothetical protein